MAAVTDRLTDEEMPRARLGLLLQHFSELDDDREAWRVMYPLKEVLLLVTCATIGVSSWALASRTGSSLGGASRQSRLLDSEAGCGN